MPLRISSNETIQNTTQHNKYDQPAFQQWTDPNATFGNMLCCEYYSDQNRW